MERCLPPPLTPTLSPSKRGEGARATITLREITFDTVRQISDLEVSDLQRGYVAPNAVSIAEAHFNPGDWFRAVYAADEPVGFVMLLDPATPGALVRSPYAPDSVGLRRLMIHHRHQRKGYGLATLDLIIAHARDKIRARRIISSYVPGEHGPKAFYLRYGFTETGRMRAGGQEIEISKDL
jgi:diamine N-acetyltransferase